MKREEGMGVWKERRDGGVLVVGRWECKFWCPGNGGALVGVGGLDFLLSCKGPGSH